MKRRLGTSPRVESKARATLGAYPFDFTQKKLPFWAIETNLGGMESIQEPKRTPLVDEHIALGAKMVDFAGWYMPVSYQGLREEHLACRASCGLFDVSHMGEVRIKGPRALETVEWLTTNFAGRLENGQAQYSLLPNADGGLVDDVIVYCLEKNTDYLICVNASNTDKILRGSSRTTVVRIFLMKARIGAKSLFRGRMRSNSRREFLAKP